MGAVGNRKSVKRALAATKEEASGKRMEEPSGIFGTFTMAEARELRSLAVDLNAAADRMGAHLDRAIEAVRASLDPAREAAYRRRYETEFAGGGESLLAGLR